VEAQPAASEGPPEAPSPLAPVSHWPVAVAFLLICVAYALLPDGLRIGPRWLLLVLAIVLYLGKFVVQRLEMYHATRLFGVGLTALTTVLIASSALFLVVRLPEGRTKPRDLLIEAAAIWGGNFLVFAIWYWEIDAGGPLKRRRGYHTSTDFLFPQMAMGDDAPPGWNPEFLDYVFLAFNTSAAFSPTDTLVLSRRAKVLMMCQSLVSLVVVGVLIARAINTLQ
jgi:uncharacterized membrane protein